MKKAITILALILMIFAVSCSNDTPAPANEVPDNEDIAVARPAVPDQGLNIEELMNFRPVLTGMTDSNIVERASSEWTNYYSGQEKVLTSSDGDMYILSDGDVFRRGDKVSAVTSSSITVNDTDYSSSTSTGRAYLDEWIDIYGSVTNSVTSSTVEKVFEFTDETGAEPVDYTVTATGTQRYDQDGSQPTSSRQLDVRFSPAIGEVSSVTINIYTYWETPEASEADPDPTPVEKTNYVITYGGASYDAADGGSVISGIVDSVFRV